MLVVLMLFALMQASPARAPFNEFETAVATGDSAAVRKTRVMTALAQRCVVAKRPTFSVGFDAAGTLVIRCAK